MPVLKVLTPSRAPHDTPAFRQRTEAQKSADNFAVLEVQMAHKYSVATDTAAFTATGAQVAGAGNVTLDLTGTLAAGRTITPPTVADLLAAIPGYQAGQTYRLRIMNRSSGNYAWTLGSQTGWTLTGTMTIAQNTFRDFLVTITSAAAIGVQSLGQVTVA